MFIFQTVGGASLSISKKDALNAGETKNKPAKQQSYQEARESVNQDATKAGLNTTQTLAALLFFDSLVKNRKMAPSDANGWAKALYDSGSAFTKKSVLELNGSSAPKNRLAPEELLKLVDLAVDLKKDAYFGERIKAFDKAGSAGNGAFRYILISLHTALKEERSPEGVFKSDSTGKLVEYSTYTKKVSQAENLNTPENSFVRLFYRARLVFGDKREDMFNKIKTMDTGAL